MYRSIMEDNKKEFGIHYPLKREAPCSRLPEKFAEEVDDIELAEDAAQEALIQMHRSISKWKKAGSLGAFLYGICRNVTKSLIRRRAKIRSRQVPIDADPLRELAEPQGSTEDLVLMRDLQRQLAVAMRGLDIQDRELVYLHEAEGMAVKELAALLDLPEGTVKSRLFRIRKKLAKVLEEAGYG